MRSFFHLRRYTVLVSRQDGSVVGIRLNYLPYFKRKCKLADGVDITNSVRWHVLHHKYLKLV